MTLLDPSPDLRELVRDLTPEQLATLIDEVPPAYAEALLDELGALGLARDLPRSPIDQAPLLVENFVERAHLSYLSERIVQAVKDVESGQDRRLIIEMPPRSGKSLLATQITPAWILSTHTSWHMVLASYSSTLATSWGRQVRRWTSDGKLGSHIEIARDSGAVENWETTDGGSFRTRSLGADLTGFGAKVLVIDDPHKGFIEAHSEAARENVWQFWTGTAQPRLDQGGSLVIVIMTRWHEDDLVGRLLSPEYPGDPGEWERISLPAVAEQDDVLGREPGAPLISPQTDETPEQALARWTKVKTGVGGYTWSALYQQRPSPPKGSIFDTDWWRYWTTDPALASRDEEGNLDPDGKTVLLESINIGSGTWVDSWDAAFKGTDSSDFVVGQRWVRIGPDRVLIAQQRGRKTFTQTIEAMELWAKTDDPVSSPYGHLVHRRIIEDAANGPAIIDTLKRKISGIKPIRPEGSKEARARAVTPEIESRNVFLPHPQQPGHEWVADFVGEFREFPNGANDDQVDAATQALRELRLQAAGGIAVPGAPQGAAGAAGGPQQGQWQPIQGLGVPGASGRRSIAAVRT